MACMLFAGSQVALIAFLVVYLWQIGVMSVAQAGLAFSLFHASGVAARLVFGWFAERRISSAALLVFSACGMAVSLIAMASFSTEWSLWAMFTVIAFAGCTGNGWVGLLFAELALALCRLFERLLPRCVLTRLERARSRHIHEARELDLYQGIRVVVIQPAP